MSNENIQSWDFNEESNLNFNDNEVFQTDDEQEIRNHNYQWMEELRLALEHGCDLGSIRSIVKCRSLADDMRLRVWKVRQKIFCIIKKISGIRKRMATCFVEIFSFLINFWFHFSFLYKMSGLLVERYCKIKFSKMKNEDLQKLVLSKYEKGELSHENF